jgi:hypothetical protein
MSVTTFFVMSRDEHGPIPFSRDVLADVLGPYAKTEPGGAIVGAWFTDRDECDIGGAERETITDLNFDYGGDRVLQAIWEIADRTDSAIYWLGCEYVYVTKEENIARIEAVVTPCEVKVLRNWRDIADHFVRFG